MDDILIASNLQLGEGWHDKVDFNVFESHVSLLLIRGRLQAPVGTLHLFAVHASRRQDKHGGRTIGTSELHSASIFECLRSAGRRIPDCTCTEGHQDDIVKWRLLFLSLIQRLVENTFAGLLPDCELVVFHCHGIGGDSCMNHVLKSITR